MSFLTKKGELMKFFAAMATLMALGLTACNDPNVAQTAKNLGLDQLGEIGSNLVVNAIKNECENQLNNQQNVVDLVLSAEQKANICGCAARELQGGLTADKLSTIVKDGKVDASIITSMVTGAMATCTSPQQTTPQNQPSEQDNNGEQGGENKQDENEQGGNHEQKS